MIVARRGKRIFVSDEIGVINIELGSHHPTTVAAALKFGMWKPILTGEEPGLAEAIKYEQKHSK